MKNPLSATESEGLLPIYVSRVGSKHDHEQSSNL